MTHRLRFLPLLLILAGVASAWPSTRATRRRSRPPSAAQRTTSPAATRGRRAARTRRCGSRDEARMIARRGPRAARTQSSPDGRSRPTRRRTPRKTAANAAQRPLDAAQIVSASDAEQPVDAPPRRRSTSILGGPSVTVDVPVLRPGRDLGERPLRRSLRRPGRPLRGRPAASPIPGQELACSPGGDARATCSSASPAGAGFAQTVSTPPAPGLRTRLRQRSGGVPGSMLFERTPGEHTYELRYADCGCEPGDALVLASACSGPPAAQ